MPLDAVRPVALKAASPMLLASSASDPSPAAASCTPSMRSVSRRSGGSGWSGGACVLGLRI